MRFITLVIKVELFIFNVGIFIEYLFETRRDWCKIISRIIIFWLVILNNRKFRIWVRSFGNRSFDFICFLISALVAVVVAKRLRHKRWWLINAKRYWRAIVIMTTNHNDRLIVIAVARLLLFLYFYYFDYIRMLI